MASLDRSCCEAALRLVWTGYAVTGRGMAGIVEGIVDGTLEKLMLPTSLCFGSFSLHVTRGILSDGASEVVLRPKTVAVLAYLLQNKGQVVTRDALLDAVWPGLAVTDDSVTQCVSEIRRALGEAGPSLLRTLPRRGYLLSAAPGLAVEPALTPPDKPSLVVLPFQNMSGDPGQDYFVDGLIEDITTALSCIRSFFVISGSSAFTYRNRSVDVRQVGRELGVRYVVEGSVRSAGGRIRITGQLIDTNTGVQLWADRFDATADDVFALQDRVTEAVAGAIEPSLRQAEIARAQRKPPQDLGAYDWYLRGVAAMQTLPMDRMREAYDIFMKAIALDPHYAAAHARAAGCLRRLKVQAMVRHGAPEPEESLRLAARATELAPDDPEVLALAAVELAYGGRKPEAALVMLQRACALNPNGALVWSRTGIVQCYLGLIEEAKASHMRALRLNPRGPDRWPSLVSLSSAHLQVGDAAEAVAWAESAVNERPSFAVNLRALVAAQVAAGELQAARATMAVLLRQAPEHRLSRMREFSGTWLPAFMQQLTEAYRAAGMPE